MNDWTIILRSMRVRGLSTALTAGSVAVSVALMLVLMSMRHAGEQAFSRGSGNVHLVVSRDSAPLMTVLNQLFYKEIPPRAIGWAEFERLRDSAPFEWAIPTQMGDSYHGQPVLATTPEFFEKFEPEVGRRWELAARRAGDAGEGRFLRDTYDVVVGSLAARETGLKVGDKIHLMHGAGGSRAAAGADGGAHAGHEHEEFTFTVVGVLRPTGSAHDRALFTQLEAAWLMHALDRREAAGHAEEEGHEHAEHDHAEHDHEHEEHAHDEHDHDHDHGHGAPISSADLTDADRMITGVLLRVATRPGMESSAGIQSVFDQLRRDPTITVAQPVQQINFLFRIVSNVDRILLAMALVVMASASVSILLSLYNSMDQRRRQIAVLRVLGSSSGRIFGLVLTESALIGGIGAAVGLVLSYVGSLAASRAMFESLGLLIEPVYGLEWVLAVIVGAVLLSALAGLAPAVRGYRTSVAENLKPAV